MAHANDPTFNSRLENLCRRLSGFLLGQMGIDSETFVPLVVATRDFYTHAGNKLSSRRRVSPASGSAVFYLNQKLRALLRAVLLLYIGLPEEQIIAVVTREATRWR